MIELAAGLPGEVKDLSIDVMPKYLGRIGSFQTDGYHRDIGSVEALARAHAEYQLKSA